MRTARRSGSSARSRPAVTGNASDRNDVLRITVRVQPRASNNALAGYSEGALRVRLQAPPVDGAANEALIAFLADTLNLGRRQVRIVSGHASRTKIIEVDGIDRATLERLTQSP